MINPDAINLYAYMGGVRVDISEYMISCSARWGMRSNRPTDRVADVGTLDIVLKNPNGEFSPGHASCFSGWKKGIYVKLDIIYDGVTYTRFKGTLSRIRIEPGTKGPRKAYITVLDWFKFALDQPVFSIAVATDKRADEGIMSVAGMMTSYPTNYDLDTGVNTFDSIFDMGSTETKDRKSTRLNSSHRL